MGKKSKKEPPQVTRGESTAVPAAKPAVPPDTKPATPAIHIQPPSHASTHPPPVSSPSPHPSSPIPRPIIPSNKPLIPNTAHTQPAIESASRTQSTAHTLMHPQPITPNAFRPYEAPAKGKFKVPPPEIEDESEDMADTDGGWGTQGDQDQDWGDGKYEDNWEGQGADDWGTQHPDGRNWKDSQASGSRRASVVGVGGTWGNPAAAATWSSPQPPPATTWNAPQPSQHDGYSAQGGWAAPAVPAKPQSAGGAWSSRVPSTTHAGHHFDTARSSDAGGQWGAPATSHTSGWGASAPESNWGAPSKNYGSSYLQGQGRERFQPALSRVLSVSQQSNAFTTLTSVSRNPPNPNHVPIPPSAFTSSHDHPKSSVYEHHNANPTVISKIGTYHTSPTTASERVRAAAARPITASKTLAMATSADATMLDAVGSRQDGHREMRFAESGGAGLADAQLAFYGKHRLASERLYWILPPEHDPRVSASLSWIQAMSVGLASLGLHKFLESRKRGALITNANYRSYRTPDEPAFDWISFEQAQPTLDKTLQESISLYDPLTTTIVFVFLPSKSRNSVGIWRRKLPIPHHVQAMYSQEVERLKAELAKKQYLVNVESLPRNYAPPGKLPPQSAPKSPPAQATPAAKKWLRWGRS